MKRTFILFLFPLFGIVMEGDSVTLQTDLTELQRDEEIEWRFNNTRMARVIRNNVLYDDDVKFKNRLQLDIQTGDLKITNFRIRDTGLYKYEISSPRGSPSKIFSVSAATDPRSDGVTFVSVTEGDSAVLHTGVPEIQEDDEILWRFRDKDVIAKIKKDEHIFSTYDNSAGGIFRSRLQLNHQTGNIIISDIRNITSGLYEVDFKKSSYTTHKSFSVTIRDKLNRVPVKEGAFVTLQSGVPKLERDDLVQWRVEHEDFVIAKINKTASSSSTFDGADGRFRGRLELDDQTGSLTIRKITPEHAGLYHLDITSSRHTISKKFIVSVCDSGLFQAAVAGGVGVGVGVILLAAAVAVYYKICKQERHRMNRQNHTWNGTQDPDYHANEGTELANTSCELQ